MDEFEPSLDERAKALRAAEDVIMPGARNDHSRFWFSEGWLAREREIALLRHRADVARRDVKIAHDELEFERGLIFELISQLEQSGDGYVQFAIRRYRENQSHE
jgi:hypothetical protein